MFEERLRDEYAGEAAKAALEMKQEEDRRESQRRAEEEAREAMEEPIKEACKILVPECLKCSECLDRNFGGWSNPKLLGGLSARDCLNILCVKHGKECTQLAEKLPTEPPKRQNDRITSVQKVTRSACWLPGCWPTQRFYSRAANAPRTQRT